MQRIFKKALALFIATAMLGVLIAPYSAIAAQRSNNVLSDQAPQIDSSGNAAWLAQDGSSSADTEVYYWNGTAVSQLTTDTVNQRSVRIEGGVVVWIASDGTDDEIYYYNGTTVTNISNDALDDDPDNNGYLSITTNSAGAKVVAWIKNDGTDYEVYTSTSGGAPAALTADAAGVGEANDDAEVNNAGNYTVWTKTDGTRTDVYYNNGTTTTQLTNNNASNLTEDSPVVDNTGKAVFRSGVGTYTMGATTYLDTPEIQYYGGSGTAAALTSNGVTEMNLGINNGQVVWAANDGHDSEIFFNGSGVASATKRLTNNGMDDASPVVNSGRVAWSGDRRTASDPDQQDYDIFLYTVSDAAFYQVNNDSNDQFSPDLNGTNIAWQGFDGSDNEVFTDVIRSTSLSLKATPSKVKKGKATTLSGTLKNSAGTKLSNKVITIKAGSKTIGTARTNSKGNFSKKVKPSRTTTYKAVYAGNGIGLAKTSKGKKVTVKR